MSKVVSIKSHPKYRDVAALREFLVEGQEDFGTKVDMERFIASDNPEVQHQLYELNEWCESLKDMPPFPIEQLLKNMHPTPGVDFSHYVGRDPGKSLSTDKLLKVMFPSGLKKGDFYNFAAVTPHTPLHHISRNQNGITIRLDNSYKVKGRDDANSDA